MPADAARSDLLVETLRSAFTTLIERNPGAFRTKFRKMARDPFSYYRGSAAVFYADVTGTGSMAGSDERWAEGDGSRVWIQGDLHAENFGTYLDADGRLVFDVNDFDESYVGPWTWDLRRFVASLVLVCWEKALPDDVIDRLVDRYVRSYVDHVRHYVEVDDDRAWALTLDNAEGAVLDTLRTSRLRTRFGLLESLTTIEGYRRRFQPGARVRRVDDDERAAVEDAFARYLETIPSGKRSRSVIFDVLDVVALSGLGIGSAGLPAYSVLIEGFSQALDNDVVLTIKQGNEAAPGRVVHEPRVEQSFRHHGHRTAVSQRALQARADRFLGWTELGDIGYVVSELSPYEEGLSWDDVIEPDDMEVLVRQLGQATAKIHCVADEDAESIVSGSVEHLIAERVGDDVDGLVRDLTEFGHAYADRSRADHRLFLDAFRGGAFQDVAPVDR